MQKHLILAVAAVALLLACTSEKPVSVKLNKSKLALDKGETVTLTATVEPADCGAALEWASSDISVATVEGGIVTGVAAGTAGITVQAGGVNGELVTGPNGNSIFLPAAGSRFRTDLYRDGFEGNYWSSALYADSPTFGLFLYFNSGGYYQSNATRRDGFSVRAVM